MSFQALAITHTAINVCRPFLLSSLANKRNTLGSQKYILSFVVSAKIHKATKLSEINIKKDNTFVSYHRFVFAFFGINP